MTTRAALIVTICLPLIATEGTAQEPMLSPPAYVAVSEGEAFVWRAGDTRQVAPNLPVVAGDRVQTVAGRLELAWNDGARLHLGEHARLDVLDATLLRLVGGRAVLTLPVGDSPWRIDTPAASVLAAAPGQYRFDVSSSGVVAVSVIFGTAEIASDAGTEVVAAGHETRVRPGERARTPQPFNSAADDPLLRWADERSLAEGSRPASAAYLPAGLRSYAATLDSQGTWLADAAYGYVWRPRAPKAWKPYVNGDWASLPGYGVMWVGRDPWSWPTHHYGRWNHRQGDWFWVPGSRWATAWVSWSTGPSYVGWCPLGLDGRPITHLPTGPIDLFRANGAYDPWFGWTIVSSHEWLGHRFRPIRPERLPLGTRSAFVMHGLPPRASYRGRRPVAREAERPFPLAPRRPAWRTETLPRLPRRVASEGPPGPPLPGRVAPRAGVPDMRIPVAGSLRRHPAADVPIAGSVVSPIVTRPRGALAPPALGNAVPMLPPMAGVRNAADRRSAARPRGLSGVGLPPSVATRPPAPLGRGISPPSVTTPVPFGAPFPVITSPPPGGGRR